MKHLLALLLILGFVPPVNSMEISEKGGAVALTGKIEKGDYDKILEHLRKRKDFPDYFSLESNGGDVLEGTRIGTLFRDTAATLAVSGPCYSACFFILVAGVNRVLTDQPVGIHRPYYEKKYFAGLSLSEAEMKYRELQSRSRNYLQAMGTPMAIIEKMSAIPSDDVYILKPHESAFLSQEQPAYSEWVRAQCETLTPAERRLFNPFDQFDESLSKKYESKEQFSRLNAKYLKAAECEKGLLQKARKKALSGG